MDGQGLSFSYSAKLMLCPIVFDTLIPMQCNHGGIYWCNIILARERSSTHSVTNSATAQMYHLPKHARDALPADYSIRLPHFKCISLDDCNLHSVRLFCISREVL